MWSTHKNWKFTFIWTWNISYMDTNRTHIQRYPNWFKFFSHYNKHTISNAIGYNTYHTLSIKIELYYLDYLISVYKQYNLTYTTFSCVNFFFLNFTFFNLRNCFFFPNWSKCCHKYVLIVNNFMVGSTHPQTTHISQLTCSYYFFNTRLLFYIKFLFFLN